MHFWKTVGKILLSIIVIPLGAIGGLLTGLMMAIGLLFVLPLTILGDIWGFDL